MTIPLLSLIAAQSALSGSHRIAVDASQTVTQVPTSLYGVFFEEINQAGDGGIYAELIRNRGFEGAADRGLPAGWQPLEGGGGTVSMDEASPLNDARRKALRIERTGDARFGAVNTGFWGVPLKRNAAYRLTMWVRGDAPVEVTLEDGGKPLGQARFEAPGSGWKRIEGTVRSAGDAAKARLVIAPHAKGTVWVAYASLMPVDTWKGRPNGLRKDLAEHVSGMKPAFVRFPGGCYIEGGNRLADRFNWKASLGPLHERGKIERSMWGYPTTYGLGYHEYLQWCEDLGADAMFVASAGMSHRETVPMEAMDEYVQEALDAIEYANGPVTSKWGALRAKNGHPKPFNLKYVEIGNENGGPNYHARYALISEAIGKRYPNIVQIAGLWGGYPTNARVDLLDEHYYSNPAFFWDNATRYDKYDRKTSPKIYVGEYAVTQQSGTGNLDAALAEAAFMTGMERNSDLVRLTSYAPLFVNVNNRQWNPNAIVFDAARSYGTPSYHVQALFANHRPDRVVKTNLTVPAAPYAPKGGFGFQTWKTQAQFKDFEVTIDGKPVALPRDTWRTAKGQWRTTGGELAQNSFVEDARAMIPEIDVRGAKRYTFRTRAMKTGGEEGFILMFQATDGDYLQWNLGGWNNTQHGFERSVGNGRSTLAQVPGRIETGRWYDLRIEANDGHIKTFIDGKLVQEMDDRPAPRFAAIAGIDERKRELVLKVVNGTEGDVATQLDLLGVNLQANARAVVLQGSRFDEENAFDAPTRIAPKTRNVKGLSNRSTYTFPARSLTILRIPIAKR
jgi:alpha-L-arabinofuranosidase